MAIILVCASISSCISIKEYKAPDIDTTNLFRDNVTTDTTTIADIAWKNYFQDSILISLIDEGLLYNYDMQIAFARIKQAEAGLAMARAAYFPNIALTAQVQHNRFSQTSTILKNHNNQFTLGIAASWEAEIWGKLTSQKRARYAQFLNSHTYKNLIQTSLIANIATTYYSLLALDEQLRITKEAVRLLKISSDTMEEMMQAGMLNGAAVQQSLGLLYNTEASIPDLENQIHQLENSLCLLIGRTPAGISRTNIRRQQIPYEMAYGIPTQALSRRPDVLQAELNFRSAFEMTNVARASFYPSITLNSGSMLGYTATTLSKFFKPENLITNIIGGLTQPIFAQRQLKGSFEIATAQQAEALYSFEQTVLAAGKEITDILYSYESSLKKNDARNKQVTALETAVYYTKELLKAGEANYTEVLSAQQNLLQAWLSRVNDKLEQLQATVNLYRALGGGIN